MPGRLSMSAPMSHSIVFSIAIRKNAVIRQSCKRFDSMENPISFVIATATLRIWYWKYARRLLIVAGCLFFSVVHRSDLVWSIFRTNNYLYNRRRRRRRKKNQCSTATQSATNYVTPWKTKMTRFEYTTIFVRIRILHKCEMWMRMEIREEKNRLP